MNLTFFQTYTHIHVCVVINGTSCCSPSVSPHFHLQLAQPIDANRIDWLVSIVESLPCVCVFSVCFLCDFTHTRTLVFLCIFVFTSISGGMKSPCIFLLLYSNLTRFTCVFFHFFYRFLFEIKFEEMFFNCQDRSLDFLCLEAFCDRNGSNYFLLICFLIILLQFVFTFICWAQLPNDGQ